MRDELIVDVFDTIDVLKDIGTPNKPNRFLSQEAWISPDGLWYSCGFGGHTIKAYNIIISNKKIYDKYIDYVKTVEPEDKLKDLFKLLIHNYSTLACDFLYNNGWCRFHNPTGGYPYPNVRIELTNYQENTIYDYMIKYETPYNPITKQKMSWK